MAIYGSWNAARGALCITHGFFSGNAGSIQNHINARTPCDVIDLYRVNRAGSVAATGTFNTRIFSPAFTGIVNKSFTPPVASYKPGQTFIGSADAGPFAHLSLEGANLPARFLPTVYGRVQCQFHQGGTVNFDNNVNQPLTIDSGDIAPTLLAPGNNGRSIRTLAAVIVNTGVGSAVGVNIGAINVRGRSFIKGDGAKL